MSDKGHFVWYDLMTTDPEAAIDFYGKVLGWTTAVMDVTDEPYTMFMSGETGVGGVNKLPEEAQKAGAPPHWLAYVATDDVDATVSRAGELGGGTVHPPTDIPTIGRFAVIRDPHGAVLSPYKSANPTPPPGPPEHGRFSWHELMSDDYEAALAFYSELFGWQKQEAMDMGEEGGGIYQMYGLGDRPLGGMMNKPPGVPAACWLFYVMVADIDGAIAKVEEGGGALINGPMDVPGGDKVAQCTDAQGAAFALHQTAG